jgi:hypothetical protein
MTGELHVRIATIPYGDFPDGVPIVGNIYPADRNGTSHRDVLFPAGPSAQPTSFTVAPGRYVIEATLPNSDVLSDEAEVADGQVIDVDLDATQSPHESHSWQYVVGNVMPRDTYFSRTTPVPRSAGSRYLDNTWLEPSIVAPVPTPPIPMPPPVLWEVSTERVPAAPYGELGEIVQAESAIAAQGVREMLQASFSQPVNAPDAYDPFSLLFRFVGPDRYQPYPAQRHFLIAEAAAETYLVTLPTPWNDARGGRSVVEVLVNLIQSPNGSPIGVTVHDPVIGAGLAYMATGALDKAARVFQDVQTMLQEKLINPFSAAAGAYILIGTELDNEPRVWDRWLTNLNSWFPQYSDGSVLRASRQLRVARSEDEIRHARNGFVEACERGLPIFTLGLSWLVDGLSQFPGDEECAMWLERVRRVARRVDMRQPFVVLRLGGPM